MIVVVEGPSAAGKTTWCRRHLTIFVPELVGALALGVGVGDTWMDWRNRVQSAT